MVNLKEFVKHQIKKGKVEDRERQKLKERFSSQRKELNPKVKGELKSPLAVLKQKQKEKAEVKEYNKQVNQERFRTSRTGRVVSGLKSLRSRNALASRLYGVEQQKKKLSSSRLKELKLQLAIARTNNQRHIARPRRNFITPEQQSQQAFRDWAFSDFRNPRFNQAGQVEKEISSFNGEGSLGSQTAFGMEKEIMNIGNLNFIGSPFQRLENEVNLLSNLQDVNALNNITNEVNVHSNVLTPQKKKRNPVGDISNEVNFFSNLVQ